MNPARTLLLVSLSLFLVAGCASADRRSRTEAHSLLCVIFCVKVDTVHSSESDPVEESTAEGSQAPPKSPTPRSPKTPQ